MTYRNVTPRLLTAVSVLALAFSLTALVALCIAQRIPMVDTLVYRAEGAAVANGTDLYGFTVTQWRLPATYPPFAAILFVPTTWLPVPALKVVFVVGNALLLALLVRLSCRFAGLPARQPLVLAAVAVGLWLEPVFQTLLFGQINLARFGALPAGTMSSSFSSTSTDSGTCSRSVQVTSLGSGQQPKVVSKTSGDCDGAARAPAIDASAAGDVGPSLHTT